MLFQCGGGTEIFLVRDCLAAAEKASSDVLGICFSAVSDLILLTGVGGWLRVVGALVVILFRVGRFRNSN